MRAQGSPEWLVPQRTFAGHRPSNTLLLERLTAEAQGKLVALYEHAVFTQGSDLEHRLIRPVGVELGKVLAKRILPEVESRDEPLPKHDSSTNALIRRYRRLRYT